MTTRRWTIDAAHSAIQFTARHMVVSKVRGVFRRWEASLEFDPNDPEKSKLTAKIDAASLDTREEKRDEHLRSADFFDVAHHPSLTFESRSVGRAGESLYRVVGDLTIRGVTREIAFDVEYLGSGKDPWGNERAGFTAAFAVQRKDFGLNWNQVLEAGGVLVGDKIEIALDIEAIKG